MDILTLQFEEFAGPEAFGAALESHGATLDIRNFGHDGRLPETIDGHDGLLILGGVMNAHDDDDYPYLGPMAALIAEFHGAGRPVLGICLGAQLIARALGGRAYPHTVPELGFVELSLNREAAGDPLLAGLGSPQHLMQWHYQTVELPAGSSLLGTSAACRNQIFRAGAATYGFQCHFEITRPLVEGWIASAGSLPDDDIHNTFIATIDGQIDRHLDGSLAFCDTVAARWTELIAARRAV